MGNTRPNPMVGCVIVHNELIISEAFTSAYGGNHAEVNAINSVADKSLLADATLYVSLEPCSHFGKTPPCADLIATHKIPEIVIGIKDPHEKVAGKGIEILEAAGCHVTVGILEKECREHHKRFLTFHEKKRPYILLKWAESADGFIAPDKDLRSKNSEPYWITNKESRQLVHQWRSEEQAILVGTNTILEDNPKLNVRNWAGKNPMRIILDRTLKIKTGFHVFDGSIPTLIITEETDPIKHIKGIDYRFANFSKDLAQQVCTILFQANITSVIIEGGTKTLQTFIDINLWDEARVFKGEIQFHKGLKAPKFSGRLLNERKLLTDTLTIYRND